MAEKKKQQERDRRAKIESMRQAERSRERRKSLLFIVIAAVVGVGLVTAAAVPAYLNSRNDPAKKDLSSFGVSASAASCDKATTDKTSGNNDHKDQGTTITYAETPPSSGPHWAQPAFPASEFYSTRDTPPLEQLVHNLEHGYTILWYDKTIKGGDLDTLKDISTSARSNSATRGKFIVAAWDDSRGTFPSGKHIALSHWGADQGHRELCGDISGAVVNDFISAYPATDAPEPNAA